MTKKPTRLQIRRAILFTFAAVLGKFDILSAAQSKPPVGRGPGQLTVDLGQWGGIVFTHRGQQVVVSMDEVFMSLRGDTR